jgi:hypothetical protein
MKKAYENDCTTVVNFDDLCSFQWSMGCDCLRLPIWITWIHGER